MEKICVFFLVFVLVFFSGRHVQNSVHLGTRALARKRSVELMNQKVSLACGQELTAGLVVFKSIYCHKRNSIKKNSSPTAALILTTSKKKRPPLYKGGLQIFFPLSKWGVLYFLD